MRTLLACGLLAATAAPLVSQSTGRTMQLLAPAVIGQTASFGMTYPVAAAGNLYVFLWCSPPFPGTAALTVPGFTLLGPILLDPPTSVSAFSGLLDASGSVAQSVAIPNDLSFLGYAWDLQSVDLDASASTVRFADNELSLVVANTLLPSMNLVAIPAGSFLMGSNAGPPDTVPPYYPWAHERPVHQVTISRPFWIGKYEVTQAEYQAVMGTNPSYFKPPNTPTYDPLRPVETVSWNDAMAYCAAVTAQQAALGRVPSGYRYRLPTEAEWEYCCRAGTTTEFHYGPTLVCGQANFAYSDHTNSSCSDPGGVQTALVGSYVPNAWGLFDMHGNVWEWCLDTWDGTANYPSLPVVDPYVGNSPPYRVVRGGSWGSDSDGCRSAYRVRIVPAYRVINRGFRVVLAPVLP